MSDNDTTTDDTTEQQGVNFGAALATALGINPERTSRIQLDITATAVPSLTVTYHVSGEEILAAMMALSAEPDTPVTDS